VKKVRLIIRRGRPIPKPILRSVLVEVQLEPEEVSDSEALAEG
jgi:hypothetical protein